MTVSTLLVCDDAAKTQRLQGLIDSRPELKLTSAADLSGAVDRVAADSPSLVWIELAPEPARGLSLLGELREKYPRVQFLVSYDSLKSDLVKSAMQLGAIEYIDPESAERLLPDAIERVVQKLNESVLGTGTSRPKVLTAPTATDVPITADDSYVPGSTASNRVVTGARAKASQLEGGPGSLPVWLLPSIMIVMILVAVAVAVVHH